VKLQQQTIIPFIIMQQEHMPPASMVQRFCIMLHAIGSSHVQVIFMPPVTFSILTVQRGTIIMLAAGMAAPMPAGWPAPIMPDRSIIIVPVFMTCLLTNRPAVRLQPPAGRFPFRG
jgi:hypothetical protein